MEKIKGTTLTSLERKENNVGRLTSPRRREEQEEDEEEEPAEAVAVSLSFGFVRFAPAPREREPRVNLFSDEADEERLNRSGNDGDRRHDSTASASAAGTTERDRLFL